MLSQYYDKEKESKTMRIRMVTRTIKASVVTAKVYNITTDSLTESTVTVTGEYKTKELEKIVSKSLPETEKFICITNVSVNEQIYGMPEDEFLQYAKPITR